MRIGSQNQVASSSIPAKFQKNDIVSITSFNSLEEQKQLPTSTFQKAVDTLNEFMEAHNNSLKFVYHEGLKEYYVEIVDSQTEEVIKEIPSKELLDVYYQMQKIIGNIVDKKV